MNGIVEPINIASGALVAQLSILAIMLIGAFSIRRGDTDARLFEKPSYAGIAWLTLSIGLVTMAALVTSDAFASTWYPVVGLANAFGLSWSAALAVTFVLDILCIAIIVFQTGGSKSSPFQGLFFLMPTLAILLREPIGRLVVYLVLVIALFTFGMVRDFQSRAEDGIRHRFAYWFVSVSSFILAVVVGYLTRPR